MRAFAWPAVAAVVLLTGCTKAATGPGPTGAATTDADGATAGVAAGHSLELAAG